MPEIAVNPLHPSLGAEISGVDLGKPLDPATREALQRALAEHLALVFHDQSLTPDQYLAAVTAFGPPMRQHYSQHHMEGYPDIGMIWHRNGQRPAERWHTDHTNRERPPAATILYGVEIPSAGGGTSVANMRAAYVALPEDERRRLDTLRTVNSLDRDHPDTLPEDREKFGKPIVHPIGAHAPGARLARGLFPHHQGAVHRGHEPRGQPRLHGGPDRADDPAGDRLPPPMAQGRRPGDRRPRHDAPRPRRLRPQPEPRPVAHHRRRRPPGTGVAQNTLVGPLAGL